MRRNTPAGLPPYAGYNYRVFGMAMTFTSLVVSSIYLLFAYARHIVA